MSKTDYSNYIILINNNILIQVLSIFFHFFILRFAFIIFAKPPNIVLYTIYMYQFHPIISIDKIVVYSYCYWICGALFFATYSMYFIFYTTFIFIVESILF